MPEGSSRIGASAAGRVASEEPIAAGRAGDPLSAEVEGEASVRPAAADVRAGVASERGEPPRRARQSADAARRRSRRIGGPGRAATRISTFVGAPCVMTGYGAREAKSVLFAGGDRGPNDVALLGPDVGRGRRASSNGIGACLPAVGTATLRDAARGPSRGRRDLEPNLERRRPEAGRCLRGQRTVSGDRRAWRAPSAAEARR